MAYLQGFQPLEQRNDKDLVVAEGVVSKSSPFATSDNNGIYDVIAENLRYLNDMLNQVKTNNDLVELRNEVKKMYNDMITNENFGAIEAKAQAKIAKEQTDIVAKRVEEANQLLAKIESEKFTINDDIADAKNTVTSVLDYLSKVEQIQASVNASLERASEQADSALKAAEQADKSKVWAEYSGSPDNKADKDSDTGKTKSSKGWALKSKEYSDIAKTSSTKAKDSATKAMSSETNASMSEVNAKNSEAKARVSELNANQSEANAKESETNAEASFQATRDNVVQAQRYFELAQTWSEGNPASETTEVEKEVMKEVKDKDGNVTYKKEKVKEQVIVTHKSAKRWAEEAKSNADVAQKAVTTADDYLTQARETAQLSTTNANNASESEVKAKSYMDKTKEYNDNCSNALKTSTLNANSTANDVVVTKKWATNAASPDGAADDESPSGFTMSSRSWALNAKESAQSAKKFYDDSQSFTERIREAMENATNIESQARALEAEIEKMKNETQSFLNEAKRIRESLSNAVNYKGSVQTYADLPTENNGIGDMWNVVEADKDHGIRAKENVIWDGTGWDATGGFIDDSAFAKLNTSATFTTVKATIFTGNLSGKATTAGTADVANSVDWSKVKNAPTTMTANGGTADMATKAGSCTGNSASATKLLTARAINGTNFDGSANITTAKWGTARSFTVKDSSSTNAGTAVSVDGSGNVTLLLPATIKADITGNASGSSSSCTGNAASASKAAQLTAARTIDGVNFNGTGNITHYGTCSTVAATAEKAVACAGFVLATGASIKVKFTVMNTAANPTLNVQGTGAKPIFYRGAAIGAACLAANRTYEFVFNGTQYELLGDINTDTNNAVSQSVSASNATYPILFCGTANATENQGNKGAFFGAGVKVNPSTSEVIASKFTGALNGNANTATKATQDGNGNNIANTYATKTEVNNSKVDTSNFVEKSQKMGSYDGAPVGSVIVSACTDTPASYINISNDYTLTSTHRTLINWLNMHGYNGAVKVGDKFPGIGKFNYLSFFMKYK